jgi:uncharacterized protein (TIGR03437 family)
VLKFIIPCLAVLAESAWGQSPTINYVVTTGLFDTSFAPGTEVYIYGTFVTHGAGRDFTIEVGDQSGGINVADTAQFITAQIPLTAPTGTQSLRVTYQGQSSNALTVTIAAYAPQFSGGGVTISGPTTPPQYSPYYPFIHNSTGQPVTPTSPAMPGEPIMFNAYGLGATVIPLTLTIAGQSVPLATIQNQPQTAGFSLLAFFVPSKAPAGVDPVILTAGGVNSNTASLPVGAAPAIGTLLNSASFASAGTAAPGSMVSVFGANFGSKTTLSTFPSTTVDGDTVLFGTTPAPIFALAGSAGQINVLVPDELPTSGTINVTVKTAAGTSPAFSLNLAPAAPGIFFDTDPLDPTRKNAVAVAANTAWVAMPLSMAAELGLPSNCTVQAEFCGQPIHPGDYLEIYATGLGAATQNGNPDGAMLPTGSVAPASGNPLYETVATPKVTIGGQAATVLFSGIAPGYTGLYQVDVHIPSNVPTGDDVQLQISMPGGASDSATISIQAP